MISALFFLFRFPYLMLKPVENQEFCLRKPANEQAEDAKAKFVPESGFGVNHISFNIN